ncbi:hypothetical protein DHW03_15695 [Pedobacter yonginense]|uniref:Uncharacterized protein n=1 Tax=Pedobacter yonginense TaxID=651869 RepID=A0A317ELS5_9SPHI|nr:hypothetical protein [Pedobacter yonginense]PWS26236.1 hypothetical protein DHW03_15695 [Pedobacter yonginense]
MLKIILKWSITRLLPPLSLQLIQVFHNIHTMALAIDQMLYIVMYCIAVMVLFFVEIAIETQVFLCEKDVYRMFYALNWLSMVLGISANIYCYEITHSGNIPREQYWVGLCGIVLISILFDVLVKLVIKIISKLKEIGLKT